MISPKIKQKLKENWGEKAKTLNCFAEVKLIDLLSSWACYIFAMDESEEVIDCVIYTDALGAEIYTLYIIDVQQMYNEHGEHPVVDDEFRRIRVIELLRRLGNVT